MKKSILGIVMMLGLVGFSQAATIDQAVTWMNENNLTIFKTVTEYKPNNYIRRDEAAKLFVNFAKLKNKDVYIKTVEECKFSDLNDAHKDLKDIVVESCRMGIFQGANGKFMPRGSLTNEQAVAVLLRVIGETQSEVGVSYRSENYYNRANEMLLFIDTPNMLNKKGLATRGDTGMGIYFMYNMAFNNNIVYKNTEYGFTLNLPSNRSGYTVSQDEWNIFISINGEIVIDIHPMLKSQGEPVGAGLIIGENSKYTFVHYGGYMSNNSDTILKMKSINTILKSFKLL